MAYFSLSAGRTQIMSMKKIITLVCIGTFFLLSAFKTAGGMDDVINALRTGNASELAKYVDDNIEISLPSKSDSYSRSQAVVILQDFFSTNGVKNFDVKFKGENGGSQYCIGTLQTRSGNYRTTFLLANRNGRQLVKEIRFQNM
jgi:hypothetical protein